MMDKRAFYAALRKRDSGLFGDSLSQRQVEGTEALLDASGGLSVPHVAHVLGEVYHETGGGMYPVKETVFPHSRNKNPTDKQVIARLDKAWKKGQLTWVRHPYWRDGMFGRGHIQTTHEPNYRKASALVGVDLVANPHRALELDISATIAMQGCATGMFTGKKLSDFDRPQGFDHFNARAIVNGDKNKRARGENKTNGQKVAQYALAFERALEESERLQGTRPPVIDHVPETPKPKQPWWMALFAALFRARKKSKPHGGER